MNHGSPSDKNEVLIKFVVTKLEKIAAGKVHTRTRALRSHETDRLASLKSSNLSGDKNKLKAHTNSNHKRFIFHKFFNFDVDTPLTKSDKKLIEVCISLNSSDHNTIYICVCVCVYSMICERQVLYGLIHILKCSIEHIVLSCLDG